MEQVTKQTAPQSNGDVSGKILPGSADSATPVALPPGVRTLLEFVAWVVYTRENSGLSRQLTGWLRGHGGYLSDSLPAVNEAAIRVQVTLTAPSSGFMLLWRICHDGCTINLTPCRARCLTR